MIDTITGSAAARWPLILVCWVDSATPESGWVPISRWESKSVECISVGYLIEDRADRLTIAAHIVHPEDEHQSQAAGVMVIPKRSIISRTDIKTFSSSACEAVEHSSDRQECELTFSSL